MSFVILQMHFSLTMYKLLSSIHCDEPLPFLTSLFHLKNLVLNVKNQCYPWKLFS